MVGLPPRTLARYIRTSVPPLKITRQTLFHGCIGIMGRQGMVGTPQVLYVVVQAAGVTVDRHQRTLADSHLSSSMGMLLEGVPHLVSL